MSSIISSTSESSLSSLAQDLAKAFKNPDDTEFQKIRNEYLEIWEDVKKLSDEAGEGRCSIEELTSHILVSLNNTFAKVQRTSEARLDVQILKQVSVLGKSTIQKTQSNLITFKPSEYAVNLINFMNNGEKLNEIFEPGSVSLQSLSSAMTFLYRSTYGFEPLYGALEWEPPKTKKVAQLKKDDFKKSLNKRSIEKVQDGTTNEENQVEEVNRVFNVLKRRFKENLSKPIPLLEFIIDPTCFSTTVQNMFHTSFLMRDSHVILSFEEHIPFIAPFRRKTQEQTESFDHKNYRQSVIEMNMSLWEEAIKIFGIKQAMIPKVVIHRKHCL